MPAVIDRVPRGRKSMSIRVSSGHPVEVYVLRYLYRRHSTMNDSSDDDVEIGPQKSAEELLRERERLAEARGDVIDVGADDADAAMPPVPVPVKPEAISIE